MIKKWGGGEYIRGKWKELEKKREEKKKKNKREKQWKIKKVSKTEEWNENDKIKEDNYG